MRLAAFFTMCYHDTNYESDDSSCVVGGIGSSLSYFCMKGITVMSDLSTWPNLFSFRTVKWA